MKTEQLSLLDIQAREGITALSVVHFLVRPLCSRKSEQQTIHAYILTHNKQTKITNQLFHDQFNQLFVGVECVKGKELSGRRDGVALYENHQTVQIYLKDYCTSFVVNMEKRKAEFYAN